MIFYDSYFELNKVCRPVDRIPFQYIHHASVAILKKISFFMLQPTNTNLRYLIYIYRDTEQFFRVSIAGRRFYRVRFKNFVWNLFRHKRLSATRTQRKQWEQLIRVWVILYRGFRLSRRHRILFEIGQFFYDRLFKQKGITVQLYNGCVLQIDL